MKNNYFSSKNTRIIDSEHFSERLKRNFRTCVGSLFLSALPTVTMYGQTNPLPQNLPYNQNFDVALNGSTTSYPIGWSGWRLEGQLGTSYLGTATADVNLSAGTNNTTSPGIFDMIGKLGFLSTNGQRTAPVLAINTTDRKFVTVKYKINVQRVNSNRGLGVKLQYRVGNTGEFTDIDTSLYEYYGTGANTNVGTGVLALVSQTIDINLPEAAWYKPEVQLRWAVARTVNEQGSGDNHSFSIDDIEVNGLIPDDLPVAFPFSDNFERANWVLVNGTQTNKFSIGTPNNGDNLQYENGKLFITNGTTNNANYSLTSASHSFAYKNITLPANITNARVSFKWIAKGESTPYDYGRFYIVPALTAAPIAGTEAADRVSPTIANALYQAKLEGVGNATYPFAIYNNAATYSGPFSTTANVFKDNNIDLSQYAGQTVRAIFYWRNDGSGGSQPGLVIDDFEFINAPTCINPTTLTTSAIEGRKANLNWVSSNTNFEYYISTTATAPTATTLPTGAAQGNTTVLTNLTPVTTYYAWVRSVCQGDEKSEWSTSATFTTGVSCVAPTVLKNTTVGSTTASITWASSAANFKYYISTSSVAPTATAETISVNQNSATLTNLAPNTTYYWWTKAICGTNDESTWSSSHSFTTTQSTLATFPIIDNFNTDNTWNILYNSIATTAPATNSISRFVVNTPPTLAIGSGTTGGNLTFGDGKLYITSPADAMAPIYKNTNSIAYAYKDVTLPNDLTHANISFKWLMKGESTFDYGRFLIVPLTEPLNFTTSLNNSTTALNNIYSFKDNPLLTTAANKVLMNNPSGANSAFIGAYETKANVYNDLSVNLAQYAGKTVRVIFYFKCDASSNYDPALIIDDFKFDYPPACVPPTALTSANVTARTADVNWTASASNPSGYEYYVATTAETPSNSTIATGTATSNTIALTNLTPETNYYIWVKSVCSTTSKSDWTSTAITFRTAISCPVPTVPTTTSVTTNGATLGWTSTATNFEYAYSTTNTAPTTNGTAVTGNSVTITNLTPNRTYYWWVRAACDTNDKSQWTVASTFTTQQVAATFPYIDNFDTNEWVFINGTQTNKFHVGTPITAEGITYADNKLFVSNDGISNSYNTSSSSVYAYRDIILPNDITTAAISFNWILKGEGGTGILTPYDYGRFYIMPIANALPTAGTNLGYDEAITGSIYSLRNNPVPVQRRAHLLYNPSATYTGAYEDIAHTYNDQNVNLAAYAGQTVRLFFFFRNDVTAYPPSLAIDNFKLELAPECLAPTVLTSTNILSRSATISWTAPTSTPSNGYEYYYSTTNTAPTNTTVASGSSATTSTTITDLAPATTYYTWVRSVCSATSKSTWVAANPFTTLISCIAPTALTSTNTTTTGTVLNWTSNSTEFEYIISLTNTAPTATSVGNTVIGNTVTLTDLIPNKKYYYWVRSNCGNIDGKSTWVAASFRTLLIPTSYPFIDNFATPNWAFEGTGQTNNFYIGTPTASEITFNNEALFISNNGIANQYTNTSATSNTYAYVDVTLPSTVPTTEISFDWYVKGENIGTSIYDYGRFFIVPTTYSPSTANTITSAEAITGAIHNSTFLQGSTGTGTTFDQAKARYVINNLNLSTYAGQTIRLLFYWRNDASTGSQPPLSIDNLYFGPTERLATSDLSDNSFTYYPNPVQNELNIKAEQTIAAIEIYNLTGQIVNQVKVKESSYLLDTSKLSTGVYMVKIDFENGTTKTVKIIKK